MASPAPARLVLLPGMDGTAELFEPLLRALPPSVAAVAVPYPQGDLLDEAGLEAHVRAAVAAAVPAGEPWFLLGESFSGPVSLAFAATRPPGLRGLLLSATFARCPVSPAVRGLRALALPALFRVPMTAPFVRTFLTGGMETPELLAKVLELPRRLDAAVMAHRLRQVLDRDVTGLLGRVEVPVLYLQARGDRLVGPESRDRIAAGIPSLETAVFDAPHLLLQVRPRETALVIADFLRRHGGVQAR